MGEQHGDSGQGYRFSDRGVSSRTPGSGGDNDWGEWIGIVVLFCIPSGVTQVIAVVWALSKLSKMSKAKKERMKEDVRRAAGRVSHEVKNAADYVRREAESWESRSAASSGGEKGHSGQSRSAAQPPKKETGRKRKIKSGRGMMSVGIIFAAIFGLVAFITGITPCPPAVPLSFLGVTLIFVAMIIGGVSRGRTRDRYLNYLAYIGANREVSLAHMAASFGLPVHKLCRDLRRMLTEGILPTGYLDLAEGKLYLTEMGYRAPEPKAEPQSEPMTEEEEDDILRQIRLVNDDISDAVMSAKIHRIEEITGKILAYRKARPEKAGQLRTFLNYYLPTTLKILRAYAQLDAQGIEGENISAAKARIEGMMDQVVSGFEKQLDKLFQGDAMDINSDVQVLENMLKKDGLSGDDGMTMTM